MPIEVFSQSQAFNHFPLYGLDVNQKIYALPGLKQRVVYKDLGTIPFSSAWEIQTSLNQRLVTAKRAGGIEYSSAPHYLLFCEHPPVYTLGKSGSEENLLANEGSLNSIRAEYYRINRGGDITFHGPGQIVGYPIFDLDRFFTDVHRYVRSLEEVVIRTLQAYGIEGKRLDDFTGVWIDDENGSQRKICAIGVHLSRWVTMHGFAMNVNTDLEYFRYIVPCGIPQGAKSVTSLSKELGKPIDIAEVQALLKSNFREVFDFEYLESQHIELQ